MMIEEVTKENFHEGSLDHFNRKQNVNRIYKKNNLGYEIVESVFVMDWSLEKKREVARDMRKEDHISYIAKDQDRILGFISVFKELTEGYMVVDMIQVDRFERRHGLGRKLFGILIEKAQRTKAKGLYISSFPSEETVHFYLAMGCSITDNPIEKYANEEPNDVQMTFLLDEMK